MAEQHSASPCGCGGQGAGHSGAMPMVTFSTFVLSLASSALVHLGEVPDPESGQTRANHELARHTIDVLAMLKDKTARCLEPDEAKLINDVLYELRIKFCAAKSASR